MLTYVVIIEQFLIEIIFMYKQISFPLLCVPILKPETLCHKTPTIDSPFPHLPA